MFQSTLKNTLNKVCNWCKYKHQRNFSNSILRKASIKFVRDLNKQKLIDNEIFWKKNKPYFKHKGNMSDNIMLVKNNKTVHKDESITKHMNNYFINKTNRLYLNSL